MKSIIVAVGIVVGVVGGGMNAAKAVPVYDVTIDTGRNLPGADNREFRPFALPFTFFGTPLPGSDAVFTMTAFGDINNIVETVPIFAETATGTFLGELYADQSFVADPIRLTDSLIIPQAVFAPFTADGSVTLWLVVDSSNAACCVRPEILNLRYDIAVAITEPNTAVAFVLGLIGLVVLRRRPKINFEVAVGGSK